MCVLTLVTVGLSVFVTCILVVLNFGGICGFFCLSLNSKLYVAALEQRQDTELPIMITINTELGAFLSTIMHQLKARNTRKWPTVCVRGCAGIWKECAVTNSTTADDSTEC